MPNSGLVIVVGFIVLGMATALLIGRRRESTKTDKLVKGLLRTASGQAAGQTMFSILSELPPPVASYFSHVLSDRQQIIKVAKLHQVGKLRTTTGASRWFSFSAAQIVVPGVPGFVWNAKVLLPFAIDLRILDSYCAGIGSGWVSLWSAFPVASESGTWELNSGALHRYLAEAVWYPTALLPHSGVLWTPIHDRAALATLKDRGTSVSLEFRFNEVGEVTGIYSPGRFGRFYGGYKQMPWEGVFRNYALRSGIRIPTYGEVGWYDAGAWQVVWKGSLTDIEYEFAP